MREPRRLRQRVVARRADGRHLHQLEPGALGEFEEVRAEPVIAVVGLAGAAAEVALVEVPEPLEVGRPDGHVLDAHRGRSVTCGAEA